MTAHESVWFKFKHHMENITRVGFASRLTIVVCRIYMDHKYVKKFKRQALEVWVYKLGNCSIILLYFLHAPLCTVSVNTYPHKGQRTLCVVCVCVCVCVCMCVCVCVCTCVFACLYRALVLAVDGFHQTTAWAVLRVIPLSGSQQAGVGYFQAYFTPIDNKHNHN